MFAGDAVSVSVVAVAVVVVIVVAVDVTMTVAVVVTEAAVAPDCMTHSPLGIARCPSYPATA